MKEVEIKILDVDIAKTKEMLIKLGGKLVKDEIQENHMYNLPPCTLNQNGFVRLRHVHDLITGNESSILCVKKIVSQGKIRETEENEVEVVDFEGCNQMLKSLNLTPFGIHKKKRTSYLYKDCLVEFDTWDKSIFPKPYIEIEGPNEKSIYNLLTDLGIPHDKATSKSLKEIVEDLKAKN